MAAAILGRFVARAFGSARGVAAYAGQELALAVARRGATMRIMTAGRPAGVILLDDMADYPRHSGKFMLKLLLAWMAMGFR
jgi:hypothetical protein